MSSEERQPNPDWRVIASAEGHAYGQSRGIRQYRERTAHFMVLAKRVSAQRIIVFACGKESWASNLYHAPLGTLKCRACLVRMRKV